MHRKQTSNAERMKKLVEIARWEIEEDQNRRANPLSILDVAPKGFVVPWSEVSAKIEEADLGYTNPVDKRIDYDEAQKIARRDISNMKIARRNRTQMDWIEYGYGGGSRCWKIYGKECEIHFQRRPPYCNRGSWLATITANAGSDLASELDAHDGWPRYYFDLERAKLEVEAWLIKRKQEIIV